MIHVVAAISIKISTQFDMMQFASSAVTELAAAMDAIPTVSGMKDGCWRVLIAIL